MKKWVVQKEVFPENYTRLKSILKDRMIDLRYKISGPHFESDPGMGFVFYGSIVAGRRLQRTHGAICWLYDYVYDCNVYMPYFKGRCINDDHVFISAGYFDAITYPCFVKQNSGYKEFTGTVCDSQVKKEVSLLDPSTMLLVSTTKRVDAEWRFVVFDNNILTYSQYGSSIHHTDDGACEFAKDTLKLSDYSPAPLWTLDVVLSDGKYYIMEVNSLLSAGWYNCDVSKIIEAVDMSIA